MGTKITDITLGLQSGVDRTLYADWAFKKPGKIGKKQQDNTVANFSVIWKYYTNDGLWFTGNESDVNYSNSPNKPYGAQSTYSAPSNAVMVQFFVRPNPQSWKSGKTTKYAFTDKEWSDVRQHTFATVPYPLSKPSAPNNELEGLILTLNVTNYDTGADHIEFVVLKNDGIQEYVFKDEAVEIRNNMATLKIGVEAGCSYRARCQIWRSWERSEFSDYTSEIKTPPAAVSAIKSVSAVKDDKTAVVLEWDTVPSATSYEIEYATKLDFFDNSDQTQTKDTGTNVGKFIISQLDVGVEWFFRLRAKNDKGESDWTGFISSILGEKPAPPTTWSLTTSVELGEDIHLYWVHNTSDGSKLESTILQYSIDNVEQPEITIPKPADDTDVTTNEYILKTDGMTPGATIRWKMKTRGIVEDAWSDFSIEREISVYAPPVVSITMHDQTGVYDRVTSFPMFITATAGPPTQNVLAYQILIVSNVSYQTTNYNGENLWISEGQEVFNRIYDVNDHSLSVELSANDVDLGNGYSYKLICRVTMSSGLTSETSLNFDVSWHTVNYFIDAEVGINEETATAVIRPYCIDSDYNEIDANVLFNIYRRDFDGSLTLIADKIDPMTVTSVTDPHPSLDEARYRIVAVDQSTGSIVYTDLTGVEVGVTDIIIQWDEVWRTLYGVVEDDPRYDPDWTGSMVRLPYNIDVSDTYKSDTTMVSYIGRSYPVAYYGTQKQSTATWNVEIPADDGDTLYAIRRLAIWQGNVYVREPSGSGYWANVEVSFSQKHREMTIPITFNITRVDGGM